MVGSNWHQQCQVDLCGQSSRTACLKLMLFTRMHSSRMRTNRSLTVCCSLLPWGGGVPGQGCLVRGCLVQGGVCLGGVWSRGVSGLGGVCSGGCLLQGGVCSRGMPGLGGLVLGGPGLGGSAPRGVCSQGVGIPACTEADTPPSCGQTHACENITLAQLRCSR